MHASPTLILRIGVTGHRLNKLNVDDQVRLKRQVSDVLGHLNQALHDVQEKQPGGRSITRTLQIVSPLAEGADRIVAEAALEQGAELIALLPFGREVYSTDFEEGSSRDDYSALLRQASEIVELDGKRGSVEIENAAYHRVGEAVVDRSDALIALWDGHQAAGTGGTGDIVALAQQRRIPVFWLPTAAAMLDKDPLTPRLILSDHIIIDGAAEELLGLAKSTLKRQL